MNTIVKAFTNKNILLFPVVLAFGCAQMFPARSEALGPGRYKVETSGNIFASKEAMIEKVDKKAASLCGNAGFEYVDEKGIDMEVSPTYHNGVLISMPYNVLNREIVCK